MARFVIQEEQQMFENHSEDLRNLIDRLINATESNQNKTKIQSICVELRAKLIH